jgi:hypothetical protein
VGPVPLLKAHSRKGVERKTEGSGGPVEKRKMVMSQHEQACTAADACDGRLSATQPESTCCCGTGLLHARQPRVLKWASASSVPKTLSARLWTRSLLETSFEVVF